jgi:hypothetical protein
LTGVGEAFGELQFGKAFVGTEIHRMPKKGHLDKRQRINYRKLEYTKKLLELY